MAKSVKRELSAKQTADLLKTLQSRFQKNPARHKGIDWTRVENRLKANSEKLFALYEMERTGGEPDVVAHEKKSGEFIFYDCSEESPKDRRSLCYDKEALDSRKEFKPKGSAVETAKEMDIELLDEDQYRYLQSLGRFDMKTSSWIKTPADVRKLGGSIFGDYRYGRVFFYHNGAQSYYGSRGFRGMLSV